MGIIVVGDLHNEFARLNELINKNKDRLEMVLACGDFGYWPNMPWAAKFDTIRNKGIPIHWCDGNHEDHWSLKERTIDELAPNVFYQPRGSYITLPDGRNVLFMGGADSIDKGARTVGETWFPEEIIRQSDIHNLPDIKIDIVISHTCPEEVLPVMLKHNRYKINDPSNAALSFILDRYIPPLWYFGHWHQYAEGIIQHESDHTVRWFALSMPGRTNWWKWLEEV
jgi:Icc-related predicted phosphoesterase